MNKEKNEYFLGQKVKIKTSKGGYRKAEIKGIVSSFKADDGCLIEYINGETDQLPCKYLRT